MVGVLKIMHKLRGLALVGVHVSNEQEKYDSGWW